MIYTHIFICITHLLDVQQPFPDIGPPQLLYPRLQLLGPLNALHQIRQTRLKERKGHTERREEKEYFRLRGKRNTSTFWWYY
jgi:hypothetical protein